MTENKNDWDNIEFIEISTEEYNNKKWMPAHPGDYIQGTYKATETGKGRGEGLLFHIIEDPEGINASILGCATLNNALENIQPGTRIRVIFKGVETSQNGREYKNYKVLVAKDDI